MFLMCVKKSAILCFLDANDFPMVFSVAIVANLVNVFFKYFVFNTIFNELLTSCDGPRR